MKQIYKNTLLDIEKKRDISFVELRKILDKQNINTKGNFAIGTNQMMDKNCFYWFGVSEEFLNIFLTLSNNKFISTKFCEPLVYITDGCLPKAKIPKRNKVYKNPMWIPIVMNITNKGREFCNSTKD